MTYTVEVWHRSASAQDEYGEPTNAFTSGGRSPAWIEQTETREMLVGRNRVSADWMLVLPVGTPLEPYDRIVHDGKTFEVVGAPWLAASPVTGERHREALLRFIEG
jgi:hypothetical protein